jgi:hypothetical protein
MNNPEEHAGKLQLEELVFKGHVGLWLETNARTEYVRQSSTLLGEGVDDGSPRGSQGCLVTRRFISIFHWIILAGL